MSARRHFHRRRRTPEIFLLARLVYADPTGVKETVAGAMLGLG
jgi:hypothetical protein